MGKTTLRKLEAYKQKHKLKDTVLSRKLQIPGNYLFRWRRAGRVIGIYQRVIEEYLKKEDARHL